MDRNYVRNCLLVPEYCKLHGCEECRTDPRKVMPDNNPTYVGDRIVAFRGPNDVLSNLHPWPAWVTINNQKIFFGSSEHCYLALKCLWLEKTEWIQSFINKDSLSAKLSVKGKIAEVTMRGEADWQERIDEWRASLAEVILEELCLIKMRAVHKFKRILVNNADKCFVELTKDKYWGTGFTEFVREEDCLTCPGRNKMGDILNKVAVMALHYEATGMYNVPRDLGLLVTSARAKWEARQQASACMFLRT